jgi:peptidoglycan/xylan/chitin deacetylase (PgdA/CDA1 family)
MTSIPITMCHGINPDGEYPLTMEHLNQLVHIAHELGFNSIDYNQLDDWRQGGNLPERPIMFDFDHPAKSMRYEVCEILARYGYSGNLFVNTGWMDPDAEGDGETTATWQELRELLDLGWHIGAHTVTHPNLSALVAEDPGGEKLQWELETCDATIKQHLGVQPRDFAFTGTSWSSVAEEKVMARYRFGRLWIVGAHYQADGEQVRYADLVGVTAGDEADGGPPQAARYITRDSNPHRLPSMEIQCRLIHDPQAFRAYLMGALGGDG